MTLWVYRAQRTRRELSFGVLSTSALLTIHNSLSSRAQVTLDGVPVTDAHLIVFALKNSGNAPVRPVDFQKPALFRFEAKSRVLSVEIAKRIPNNIEAEVSFDENSATLAPMLLNPGEYLVLQALVSGRDPTVTCDLRVEGISALRQVRRGAPAESKDIYARTGGMLLRLPFQAAILWFIVNLFDAVFHAKVTELVTINGSLTFGLISIALVMSLLDEAADWLKTKYRTFGNRAIDDF